MMKKLLRQTEKYIRTNGMIREGDIVITGVSGGADSICLLFVLAGLRERLGFQVKVCHVNHGLRGEQADADERYVREICGQLHVEARFFHENVELIARKRKQSCEEAGRSVRREAFERMCEEDGGTRIATAHHRDDNVETVLLNAARGTGLKGLCGIWPVRGRWIRPLLFLGREEIEAALAGEGIRWCRDATNEEDFFTRNRIRHHILPALEEQVNAGAVRHLDELSAQARELWEYVEEGTRSAWSRCVEEEADEIRIRIPDLEQENRMIRGQLVKRCLAHIRGGEKDLESVHVSDVLSLMQKQSGRKISLPGNLEAERVYSVIRIRKKPAADAAPGDGRPAGKAGEEIPLAVPGTTRIPGRGLLITCTVSDWDGSREIPQKKYTKWMDYDIIQYGLSLRTRQPGDYLTVDAEGSRQKLKSYFINEKIPREERGRILLIADGREIVWIPGGRMSRAYYVSRNTKKIIEIEITKERKNVRDNQSTCSGRKSG